MAAGAATSGQADFGAGIWRTPEAPKNAAFDLVNLLLDDQGQPFRRGGSAYKTTADATATLKGLADVHVAAGRRTYVWEGTRLYVVNADDQTLTAFAFANSNIAPNDLARGVVVGGIFFVPSRAGTAITEGQFAFHAGSRKAANYSTGTVTVTNGSRTVTGAGTSWAANADAGMILTTPAGLVYMPVQSVDSDTQLTLVDPWPKATAAGTTYTLFAAESGNFRPDQGWSTGGLPLFLASVGTVPRLVGGMANRVYFSAPGDPFTKAATDYHELPAGEVVIGLEGVGDTCVVFTANGAWAIENMDFDPLDDAANIQHTVRQLNEVVLLGDAGVARWRGALLVPAVDDVFLMPLDGEPIPVSEGIRPLYRKYVRDGYSPGIATVHRGHYFLPIVNGTTLVDVLVCRLDRPYGNQYSRSGYPWTRWSGHAAGIAYTQRIGATTRSPKLFSIAGLRVTELTDAWAPSASNAAEADASVHTFKVETRDLATPSRGKGSRVTRVKVRYEAAAAGAVAVTAAVASGLEGAAYTALSLARDGGGGASDGQDESEWTIVNVRAPAVRFKIESSSALSGFTLRSVSVDYEQIG